MFRLNPARLITTFVPVVLLVGCAGVSVILPDGRLDIVPLNTVRVDLINDTLFDVHPRIVFDDDSGWLARWFPSEKLSTGTLAPGGVLTYHFDCDELGLIRSDEAEQLVGPFVYTAAATRTLLREKQYKCGDLIEFQFIGNADGFGVVVAVNRRVID